MLTIAQPIHALLGEKGEALEGARESPPQGRYFAPYLKLKLQCQLSNSSIDGRDTDDAERG